MFILIGPDGTGKTTLAKKLGAKLGMRVIRYTKASRYEDYMEELCETIADTSIMDRFAVCEAAYAETMGREFAYSKKQWHNMILTMLSYNPCIILCTHKPLEENYIDDYLPYKKFDEILKRYLLFTEQNSITCIPYDYMHWESNFIPVVETFKATERKMRDDYLWCKGMKIAGFGFIGSHSPDLLIVAERIGPNNTYNIPFQTGPTGQQMTDFIEYMHFPLGKLAITNMVKAARRDERKVNVHDLELLEDELDHLQPKAVLLLGAVSKAAIPLLKKRKVQYAQVPHFGMYNRSGRGSNMTPIYEKYSAIVKGLLGFDTGRKTLL